jgi:hypothetical protein
MQSVTKRVAKPWCVHAEASGYCFAESDLGYFRSRYAEDAFAGDSTTSMFAFTRLTEHTLKAAFWRRGCLFWTKHQWVKWAHSHSRELDALALTLYPPDTLELMAAANKTITEVHRRRLFPRDFTKEDVKAMHGAAKMLGVVVMMFTEMTREQIHNFPLGVGGNTALQGITFLLPDTRIPKHLREGVPRVVQLGLAPAAVCWEIGNATWRRRVSLAAGSCDALACERGEHL